MCHTLHTSHKNRTLHPYTRYNVAMHVAARMRDMDKLLTTMAHLKAASVDDAALTPDLITFNVLMDALARTGAPERCRGVLEEMAKTGTGVDLGY